MEWHVKEETRHQRAGRGLLSPRDGTWRSGWATLGSCPPGAVPPAEPDAFGFVQASFGKDPSPPPLGVFLPFKRVVNVKTDCV